MAIFRNCRGSLRLFLSLALFNGLRRTEIMTLQWSGINFDHCYLSIGSAFNKNNRGRRIPFNDIVSVLLRERSREIAGRSKWVFPNQEDDRRHAHVTGLKTAWATCLRRSGLEDVTWHDLRATYETYAHKSVEHTDTQREKFADASSDVQRRIYVTMDHADLRGLENVVQVPGLREIIVQGRGNLGEKDV